MLNANVSTSRISDSGRPASKHSIHNVIAVALFQQEPLEALDKVTKSIVVCSS